MTGTRQIRKMLKRLDIEFQILADASKDKISNGIDEWGSYYNFDPKVCVVELRSCEPKMGNPQQRRIRKTSPSADQINTSI